MLAETGPIDLVLETPEKSAGIENPGEPRDGSGFNRAGDDVEKLVGGGEPETIDTADFNGERCLPKGLVITGAPGVGEQMPMEIDFQALRVGEIERVTQSEDGGSDFAGGGPPIFLEELDGQGCLVEGDKQVGILEIASAGI